MQVEMQVAHKPSKIPTDSTDESAEGSNNNKQQEVVWTSNKSLLHLMKDVRYYIIRLVSCPVPFMPAKLPFLGGRSIIEIIALLAVIVIGVLAGGSSGRAADMLGAVTILTCMRWNLFDFILGMSFERAIAVHKMFAVAATIVTGFHSRKGFSPSGVGIISCMCIAAASYFIKPLWFELFYYVHIISYIIIIPLILTHFSAFYFAYAAIFWFIDLLLRYAITQNRKKMTATLLPGDVVRLKFQKDSFTYHPGQYVFIMIPSLKLVEYHPFSISSAPSDEYVSLHIRQLGDWSTKLAAMVKEQCLAAAGSDSVELDVFMEGPYGNHMINIESDTYEVILMISGGIGITPLQSLHSHIMTQVEQGRKMRKVLFVWSVKDRALVDAMMDTESAAGAASGGAEKLPLSFQPPMPASPKNVVASGDYRKVSPSNSHANLEAALSTSNATDGVDKREHSIASDLVFYNEFYLTRVRDETEFDAAGIHPEVQQWLKFGRPDLEKLFSEVQTMCNKSGIKKVGVCVCGPQPMVDEVQQRCAASFYKCGADSVTFHCHSEVFDF